MKYFMFVWTAVLVGCLFACLASCSRPDSGVMNLGSPGQQTRMRLDEAINVRHTVSFYILTDSQTGEQYLASSKGGIVPLKEIRAEAEK